jgi:dihydropteroate synthase
MFGAPNLESIGSPPLTETLYLRPLGMLWGKAAAQACAERMALPVAGGPAACLAFEIVERVAGKAVRRLASASDLVASREPPIKTLLDRITGPRPAIAGLSFERPLIMGIANVTPDSFSDGGEFEIAERAIAHLRSMASEGADILDIGGESTRPGAEPVAEVEELRRVMPVIGGSAGLQRPVSIDTRKAGVMREAVRAGAAIINDVAALTYEAGVLETAARLHVPIILMHAQGDPRTMQDRPAYNDVLLDVYDFLATRIRAAEDAGIARSMLIADPGIGFGKTVRHNLALLAGMSLLHGLGVPLLLGASRKRFIGAITGESDPKRRGPGSIGAALAAAAQGVQIFRVHDVAEARQALDCWRASLAD